MGHLVILNLGVINVPYSDSSYGPSKSKTKPLGQARRGKANAPHNHAPNTQTTGDVAEILEDRYHVMEVFFTVREGDISAALEGSLAGALDNVMAGAPGTIIGCMTPGAFPGQVCSPIPVGIPGSTSGGCCTAPPSS